MSETAAVPADRRAAEQRVALDRTWSRPAGLYGRLCAADHKTIGTITRAFEARISVVSVLPEAREMALSCLRLCS